MGPHPVVPGTPPPYPRSARGEFPGLACGSCAHWRKTSDPEYPPDKARGECRLNPPTVVARSIVTETVWPTTAESDWCGQWNGRPRKKAEDAA